MFNIIFKSLPLHTTLPGRLVSSTLQNFKGWYFTSKTEQHGNSCGALGWI